MAKKELVKSTSSMTTFKVPNASTGQIYITTGNGGSGGINGVTSWSNVPNNISTFTNAKGKTVLTIPNNEKPSIQITGEILWNGMNLQDRLERIETMLHIPIRDVIMEEKYSKLKNLWEQYTTALELYKTWETLKDSK